MSSSRIAFAFAAALATSTTAFAPLAHAADATQPSGMRGFLTPQQRAMLMMDVGGQWQGMTDDQRHAARDKMRADWMAMSQTDREKKRDALQAKWDALPQTQKDAMNARIQQWAARHNQGGDGQ